MKGGTVFHFVTDGIEAALERARQAAGSKDIRIGGGVATIREYLRARLVDDLHIAVSPVLLGRGESLFDGIDLPALGYAVSEHVATPTAMHLRFRRDQP
jgi:dihydrofolate reductase